jgi:hypothetical protein
VGVPGERGGEQQASPRFWLRGVAGVGVGLWVAHGVVTVSECVRLVVVVGNRDRWQ